MFELGRISGAARVGFREAGQRFLEVPEASRAGPGAGPEASLEAQGKALEQVQKLRSTAEEHPRNPGAHEQA